jgi:MFS family permease
MPLMPTPSFFYLLRIVQGVGSALLFAPTEAAINIISPPEKRASNMGLYGLVFAAGFAMGPIIGTSLYAINVAAPFIFGSLFCFVAIVVLIFGFDETPVPLQKTTWGFFNLMDVIKIPLMAAACYAVVEVSMISFLSLYLDELAISGAALGIVFTSFAVGGSISPYPAGKIADKLGKLPVLKICGFMLLAVTFSFNIFHNYIVICILTFSVGLISGALYPVSLALIGESVPPQKMGTANASFSFFYGLGSIVSPVITGWVVEITSIKFLFYPMASSALLFVIISAIDSQKSLSQNVNK